MFSQSRTQPPRTGWGSLTAHAIVVLDTTHDITSQILFEHLFYIHYVYTYVSIMCTLRTTMLNHALNTLVQEGGPSLHRPS